MGSAAVKRFLREDYHVIAVARSGSALGFAEGSPNFELHSVDLANATASKDFFTEIISLKGQIDVALLLTGGFAAGNVEKTDTTEIERMIGLNFNTVYNAARPLFLQMLQNGSGHLVFVGAKSARTAATGKHMLGYALSKSLLVKLRDILNAEASGTRVTVSVIVPDTLDTVVNRTAMPNADSSAWTPPEEIADILYGICNGKGKTGVL